MRTGYLLADLSGSRSSWASKVKYRAVRRPLAGFRSLSRFTRRLPQPRLIPAKVKTNAARVSVQEVLRLIILPVMNLPVCGGQARSSLFCYGAISRDSQYVTLGKCECDTIILVESSMPTCGCLCGRQAKRTGTK